MKNSATRTNRENRSIASVSHLVKDSFADLKIRREYSETYLLVCVRGPIALSEIRRSASKKELVVKALSTLEKRGLVFSMRFNGHRQYEATPAKLAMSSMIIDRMWKEVPSEDYLHRAPRNVSDQLEHLRRQCTSCATRLEALAPLPAPLRREPYWIQGDDAISGFLMKAIARGRSVLRSIVAPPWIGKLPMVWSAVTYIRGLGASYYRLSDPETFASFGYQINKRDMEDVGVELRILRVDPLNVPKIYLVDDSLAAVLTKDASGDGCVVYEMPKEIDNQKASFTRLWDDSVAAEVLLMQLRKQRTSLLNSAREYLSGPELEAYELLLDFGVFCYPSHLRNVCRLNESEIHRWSTKLMDHELARESRAALGVGPLFRLAIPTWWEDPRKRSEFLVTIMPHTVKMLLEMIEKTPCLGVNKLRSSLLHGISGSSFKKYIRKLVEYNWIRQCTSSTEEQVWGLSTKGYEITEQGRTQLVLKRRQDESHQGS